MDIVNEKTTYIAAIILYDESDNPLIPLNGTYRIDDSFTGTTIFTGAPFPVLNNTFDIVISSEYNSIIHGNPYEERVITLEFDHGIGPKHVTHEYQYLVKNLWKIT